MDYQLFKEFDKFTQIDIILQNGELVGRRKQYGDMVLLFSLGNFYVELFCIEEQNEILAIFSSDKEEIFEPYLNQINLSNLLS